MYALANWFKRHFSDPQVVFLALLLAAGFGVVLTMGDMLAPVFASVVIAYLLEGVANHLEHHGVPRMVAVMLVYGCFLAFLFFVLFALLPLLSTQLSQLFQQVPTMIAKGQQALMRLPELYPQYVDEEQVLELISWIRKEVGKMGQGVLSISLSSVVGLISVLIYAVLMPLLVFFFLKDRDQILGWFSLYLPKDRRLAREVWREVDRQIGNYVRGKFWEILIVWSVSAVTFSLMGLQYAMLLGVIVGLSVLVPYVGAVVATVPIMLIAYYQWGWGSEFLYVLLAYAVIQALDGNVLVPLLFSEAVDLHPVAIIVAVLVFGGLWGFWGVFFAIPLATLVNAVLRAWPGRGGVAPATAEVPATSVQGERSAPR